MIKKPYFFFSKNYLKTSSYANGDDTADLQPLYDNDVNTVLQTGELPYEKTIFFTDNFGNFVNRTFDTLILLNTNVKNLIVSAADTSGVYTPVLYVTENTEKNVFKNIESKITTSSIKINIAASNASYAEIGELKICNFLVDLCALTKSKEGKDCNAGSFSTTNGRLIHYKDFSKWTNGLEIENLSKADFDVLSSEIESEEEMIIAPYLDLDIKAIYECYVKPEIKYSVDRKTELYNLSIDTREL
ncbi:hypothetical protein Dip510_001652 [Elusimicrobium posterum]|uniref:hypothetical protein n=1 Tax=Elusimicrobium posterum TaxID=3116653 RepID=UPI003C77FEE2